jgi:glycyl-tRNA synthetase beta chain
VRARIPRCGTLEIGKAPKPGVDLFFDQALVMAEQREVRENRGRLLTEIGALFGRAAEFRRIHADAV